MSIAFNSISTLSSWVCFLIESMDFEMNLAANIFSPVTITPDLHVVMLNLDIVTSTNISTFHNYHDIIMNTNTSSSFRE